MTARPWTGSGPEPTPDRIEIARRTVAEAEARAAHEEELAGVLRAHAEGHENDAFNARQQAERYKAWLDSVENGVTGPRVVFDVPVQCLVTVRAGVVVEIHLLPMESDPGYTGPRSAVYHADQDGDVAGARRVLDKDDWPPLRGLPSDVVWEG